MEKYIQCPVCGSWILDRHLWEMRSWERYPCICGAQLHISYVETIVDDYEVPEYFVAAEGSNERTWIGDLSDE
jgi:hypothetical protein